MPESYYNWVAQVVKGLRGRPKSDTIFRDEITYFRLAASSARAFAKSIGSEITEVFEKKQAYSTILDKHIDEKIIVFCEFEETVRELEALASDRQAFVLTGSVPLFNREGIIRRFSESDNALLIMTSIGAEGLDLQFCAVMINYDLNWNPMVLEQRIGRIDRIGQKKDEIKIYNIVVEGSIDERIVRVLGQKLGLVEGSVLEPASVIANSAHTLFLEENFEDEARRAEALAKAMELSTAVILEDYRLADLIDASFCNVAHIEACGVQRGWVALDNAK